MSVEIVLQNTHSKYTPYMIDRNTLDQDYPKPRRITYTFTMTLVLDDIPTYAMTLDLDDLPTYTMTFVLDDLPTYTVTLVLEKDKNTWPAMPHIEPNKISPVSCSSLISSFSMTTANTDRMA